MALFWRIWLTVVLVSLAAVTGFIGLATVQYATIHGRLAGERLLVLADRTVAPFAAAARLGLPLDSVRNAGALLERARQTDEDILALHVFDAAGRVVHSTATPPPDRVPAAAWRARTDAAGRPWFRETDDGFIASVDVRARDQTLAGGILVVYPGNASRTEVRAMLAELGLSAVLLGLPATLAFSLLLRWGLSGPIARFEGIEAAVREFERDAWRREAAGDPSPAARDALWQGLESAASRYRDAGRALAAAKGSRG